jgi:hypothetical protein
LHPRKFLAMLCGLEKMQRQDIVGSMRYRAIEFLVSE